MPTNTLIDGKWYLLLFREYAKFLVHESRYDVYFVSSENLPQKVDKENFYELDKKVKHYEDINTFGDCFVLELVLPYLDIELTTDFDKNRFRINSRYRRSDALRNKILRDE